MRPTRNLREPTSHLGVGLYASPASTPGISFALLMLFRHTWVNDLAKPTFVAYIMANAEACACHGCLTLQATRTRSCSTAAGGPHMAHSSQTSQTLLTGTHGRPRSPSSHAHIAALPDLFSRITLENCLYQLGESSDSARKLLVSVGQFNRITLENCLYQLGNPAGWSRNRVITTTPYDRLLSHVHSAGRQLGRANMRNYAIFGLVVDIPDNCQQA